MVVLVTGLAVLVVAVVQIGAVDEVEVVVVSCCGGDDVSNEVMTGVLAAAVGLGMLMMILLAVVV